MNLSFTKWSYALCALLLMWGAVALLPSCTEKQSDGFKPLERWTMGERSVRDTVLAVQAGERWSAEGRYGNFLLRGEAFTQPGAEASLWFHTDGGQAGYEVVLRNGAIDGTRKSGSLATVRNLYRSLADDGQWFAFDVAVRGKNISVRINGTEVVCYTEPAKPYRTAAYTKRLLSEGAIQVQGVVGEVRLRNLAIRDLPANARNESDTLPPVDEQTDAVIRLQQRNFPVIDYHVHLKGGLTKEMAHAKSMNYGINYGVAPNAGEGGVGRMLANDSEVYAYFNEVKDMPFLRGVQGEGRKWTVTFSPEALGVFDYLFTDAMTIIDPQGNNARIYRPEEVHYAGTKDQYMEHLVDQTVQIFTNEPADIYANATYLPEDMQAAYDAYWTPERVDRVLDVLQQYGIALEINARYRIPNYRIIRRAKERGIKFTFGTNNVDADFGRLEYSLGAIDSCGLQAGDMWFPSMSKRRSRRVVIYNDIQRNEKKRQLLLKEQLEKDRR